MFKVIIDTNILIDAGEDNFSYARRILDEVIKGHIWAFATHKIWREYQLILHRLINDQQHLAWANKFFSALKIVESKIKLDVVRYDKEDNKFFEVAVTVKAHYIITSDIHFFEVGEYQGIEPIKPKDFWLKYEASLDKSGQVEWQKWVKNIIGQ